MFHYWSQILFCFSVVYSPRTVNKTPYAHASCLIYFVPWQLENMVHKKRPSSTVKEKKVSLSEKLTSTYPSVQRLESTPATSSWALGNISKNKTHHYLKKKKKRFYLYSASNNHEYIWIYEPNWQNEKKTCKLDTLIKLCTFWILINE